MKKGNDDIRDAYLKPSGTGIRVRRLHNEIVPMFEEHDARVSAGYNLLEWYDMSPMDRATEVAYYRIHKLVENHQMQDSMKKKA